MPGPAVSRVAAGVAAAVLAGLLLPLTPAAASPGVRSLPIAVGSPPLKGTLTLPAGNGPFPVVVLVSGSGPEDQDEDLGPNHPFLDLADGLAARGVATIRYDKRTYDYPHSVDPSTFTPTEEYVPDALAAIALAAHDRAIDPHRIFVLGHSQGGTFAPRIAQRSSRVAGVILAAAAAAPFGPTLVRQVTYLTTLPGSIGSQARNELPQIEAVAAAIDSPDLASLPRSTVMYGGTGPAYWLDLRAYDPVTTARALHRPILVLQGGRDYQVTVADDLARWKRGLAGVPGVTVKVFPADDHLFLSGSGPPTPAEYQVPGHVDPAVVAAVAAWVHSVR